jgi:prepilin-type N-terminal cleavage/methylation domain-containing protein
MRSGDCCGDCPKVRRGTTQTAFTLIELIVVMAIVALLVSVAAPKYFRSVEQAREQSLRTTLKVMRDAIDQLRYLRELPRDAVTGRRDQWQLTLAELVPVSAGYGAAPGAAPFTMAGQESPAPEIVDVRSGAPGADSAGVLFRDY